MSMDQPSSPDRPLPPKKSPWPWILGLGCGIPILLVGGCIGFAVVKTKQAFQDPKFRQKMMDVSQDMAKMKVMVKPDSQVATKTKEGSLEVKGTLVNKTDEPIQYLEVTVNGIDKSGKTVGKGKDTTTNVAPHASWNYDVLIKDKAAVTAGDPKPSVMMTAIFDK